MATYVRRHRHHPRNKPSPVRAEREQLVCFGAGPSRLRNRTRNAAQWPRQTTYTLRYSNAPSTVSGSLSPILS